MRGKKGTYEMLSTIKIFKHYSLEFNGSGLIAFKPGRSVHIIIHNFSREGKSRELNPGYIAAIPGQTVFLK